MRRGSLGAVQQTGCLGRAVVDRYAKIGLYPSSVVQVSYEWRSIDDRCAPIHAAR